MFNPSTFDTTGMLDDIIVFDANGTISNPYNRYGGQPENYGFTPEWMLYNVLNGIISAGYGIDYYEMYNKFYSSTFHSAINSAVTDVQGNTTYYQHHGINGTSGSDVIFDFGGNNVVDAGAGDDFILVGAGNDAVAAGDGDDYVFTAIGDDIVDGGNGIDKIYLHDGDDLARGGRDNDQIFGENGNDKLWGQHGHDILDGGAGNDKLYGGGGRDQLYGREGNDLLKGGGGRDYLSGGEGSDTLIGGNGRDTFGYNLGDEDDTIKDFDTSRDKIELDTDLGVSTFSDTMAHATQVGSDVVFDFGNGDTLTLENIQISDLAANDFAFV